MAAYMFLPFKSVFSIDVRHLAALTAESVRSRLNEACTSGHCSFTPILFAKLFKL